MKNRSTFRVASALACGLAFGILDVPLVGAAFEDVERGVRAAGLGGAYVAAADDAAGMFWNPASLRLLSGGEFSTEFGRPYGLEEADQLAFAWAQPD